MQLSKFTDYSVRVLIYLAALPPGELTNIAAVSDLYNISKNHLVKVIHKLGQLDYIETLQGKKGGIRLKMPATEIAIGELIRTLESMRLLDCRVEACSASPACRLKNYLAIAAENFLQELNRYTIHDLVVDNPKLQEIFFLRSEETLCEIG